MSPRIGIRVASPNGDGMVVLALALLLAGNGPQGGRARAQIEEKGPPSQENKKAEPRPAEDDLVGRLMRKAVTDSDEDLMDGILRMMNDVTRRLQLDFDPGEETQGAQRGISEKLDEAIKIAAQRRRMQNVDATAQGPDKRRMPSTARREEVGRSRPADRGAQPSDAEKPGESAPVRAQPTGGELLEMRRGWGHLPLREREELLQGIDEEFLERYRVWIERYYRSLQEPDR